MQGRGGIGTSKHRKSGVAPKSPKLRHQLRRMAMETNRVRESTCKYSNIQELMDSNNAST